MKRILLAEDDNDMRQFLTRALKNAGYEVVSFDNGLSAYERLREEPFSLLLSDIVMPEMDGAQSRQRRAQGCLGAEQAVPSQGSGQRGRAAAGRLGNSTVAAIQHGLVRFGAHVPI